MPQPSGQAPLAAIDDRMYRAVRAALHDHQHIERVILAVTRAQNWWGIGGLAAIVVDRDRRLAWARANTVLGAAWAAAKLISRTVRRPRPNLTDCPPARHKTDRESFPSTHTTVSFAAAVALPPLLPQPPLILLAITTATTRLLLGEHHPTDVAAGAALGAALAAPLAHSVKHDPKTAAVRRPSGTRLVRKLSHNPAARCSVIKPSAQPDGRKLTGLVVAVVIARWASSKARPVSVSA